MNIVLTEADSTVRSETEIPEGWAEAPLRELGELFCGQSPNTLFVNAIGNGTPYVTGPDQWDGNQLRVDKWTTDPKRTVPKGCVFVTVKGAGVGTIFPGVEGAIGRDVYAFKPAAEVHHTLVLRALELTVRLRSACKETADEDDDSGRFHGRKAYASCRQCQ
jgi:type I restriction enzyme S subunit